MNYEQRYRNKDGTFLIEIALKHPLQLFNSFDPAPFLEKDLDDQAEAYLFDAAKEFHLKTPLAILVHLPKSEAGELADSIPEAIRNFFTYAATRSSQRLAFTLRKGRLALLIGVITLVACFILGELLLSMYEGPLMQLIALGLHIGGWVAMWRPIEVLLYDWWPLRWDRQIQQKLQRIPVSIEFY